MKNHTPKFNVSCPTQIRFGIGARRDLSGVLPPDARRVLIVTGASGTAAEPVLQSLRDLGLDITQVHCGSEPSVPFIESVLDDITDTRPDAIIGCGGGSVMDTAKLLAFLVSHNLTLCDDFARIDPALLAVASDIACIAIPTTAGTGAEVTANAVLSVPTKHAKLSLRGRALQPETALVDPNLMMSAPTHVVLQSGLDAVTQVIESYTSNAATPFSDALSRPAIASGLAALRDVVHAPDAQVWSDLAWASTASGLALANSGLGAAHGLAAVIGGRFAAPHGALCGRLLVPVLRANTRRAAQGSPAQCKLSDCAKWIADAFAPRTGHDALSGFEAWIDGQNLPRLADWGVSRDQFDTLASEGMRASSTQKNAVPLAKEDFVRVLNDAL